MKIKAVSLALPLLTLVCAVGAVPAFADSTDTYDYLFSMPTIVDGVEQTGSMAQLDFTFSDGPFGAPGSSYVSYTPTGSALVDGWSVGGALNTAFSYPSFDPDYNEMLIEYTDVSGNVLSFAFIESDSFWATAGTNLSFNNGDLGGAYGLLWIDPSDPNTQSWGQTNVGASYTFTPAGGGAPSDPPCENCTVTITDTPQITDTPEPSSLLLLGSGLAGLLGVARRRIGQRA